MRVFPGQLFHATSTIGITELTKGRVAWAAMSLRRSLGVEGAQWGMICHPLPPVVKANPLLTVRRTE